MGEVSPALIGGEVVEEVADAAPEGVDGALCGLAQERLQFGEDLLDRVEVRRVRRQVEEAGASGLDRAADARDLVGRQVVEDDDIARASVPGIARRRCGRWCRSSPGR